ncbi:BatD family protein [Mucilaginibacter sp.]|uniref:BatD family protein n=1 Tax=Mucilaginibacter sp. TaxID=1882438 RepID=UPI003D0AD430
MNKQFFYNILFIISLLSGYSISTSAQSVQVEAKVDQGTIRIGDQTKLRLIVHQPAKEHINFPVLTDTLTGKVQVIGSVKADTVVDQKDHNQLTVIQSYTITCFDAGTYTIPAYSFGSATGAVKSNEVTLQVQTVQVDTTKSIYDIKQPMAVSYTFFDWLRDNWLWVALPLLIVLLIIGTIWYLRKRPKKEKVVEEIKPAVPAHVIALGKLQQLRDKKLWQQDSVKEYHSELSDIIREYLENRYAIKTHEKTTEEIFAGLKYIDLAEPNRNKLRQILLLADLVKFAKAKPLPADNEESMENAISLVTQTQLVIEKPRTEGGANTHV